MKIISLKLKMGNEKITSFGGSISLADFIKKLGIEERLDSYLPKAGSNRGYKPSQKILSFLSSVMLSGEGRYSNIDRLRKDETVKTIWGLNNMPHSTKIGEWFLKNGESKGDFATGKTKKIIDDISLNLVVEALKEKNIKEAVFDADVSLIEANKKHILLQKKHAFSIHAKEYIKRTYKGFRGMGSCELEFKNLTEEKHISGF